MNSSIKVVPKGWGFEKWIVNNEQYCGKLLYFIKGKPDRISWCVKRYVLMTKKLVAYKKPGTKLSTPIVKTEL